MEETILTEQIEEPTQEVEETVEPTAEEPITETAPEQTQEKTYTRVELQAELDRVAKQERERGKRQTEKEYAPFKDLAEIVQQGAGLEVNDPSELSKVLRQAFEQQGVKFPEKKAELNQREQSVLGRADAEETVKNGLDYVMDELKEFEKKQPQTQREIEYMNTLMDYASVQMAAKDLESKGIDSKKIFADRDFQEFAKDFRTDIPLSRIYEKWQKSKGEKPTAPESTGSVKGAGKTNDTYFTLDQVKSMSRDEIHKNFKSIEKSRKQWK